AVEDHDTGMDAGDNETWCTGFNNDNFRSAFNPPPMDRIGPTTANSGLGGRGSDCQYTMFGSSHPAGWHMAWCDGHVEMMSYTIDLKVHRAGANRADEGEPYAAAATCPSGP